MEKKVKLDYNVKTDDLRLAFATMNNVVNTMNKIGMLNLNIMQVVMLNAAFTWFFNHYAETVADMAFEKMKEYQGIHVQRQKVCRIHPANGCRVAIRTFRLVNDRMRIPCCIGNGFLRITHGKGCCVYACVH